MPRLLRWLAGIDTGEEAHDGCVIDAAGVRVGERRIAHSGAGMGELVTWLTQVCDGRRDELGVALESPHGAVVDTLLESGFQAFSINPKQADRFRDRHAPAGSKDNRLDAYVLADALRTDQHLFRSLKPLSLLVVGLRGLLHSEGTFKQEARRLANRLRSLLCRVFPQLLELAPAADEPWLWALLAQAPHPAAAARLSETTIRELLRAHRIRRWSASDVLERLQRVPLPAAPGVIEATTQSVAWLLPSLRLAHQQLHSCARANAELLQRPLAAQASQDEQREHRDLQILLTLPAAGRVIVSTMLAEASQALQHRDYHALRAQAGIAPVTRATGQRCRRVLMRHACNARLRSAVFCWANLAIQRDPKARALYQTHRHMNHTFPRSIRAVADRLLAMLIALLKNDCFYDPARRVA
ncbi:MAG: IS110 family transposase [Acidobacteria bacterium]|nr:IS110 family transposase [Acidobacteriota bacterium]